MKFEIEYEYGYFVVKNDEGGVRWEYDLDLEEPLNYRLIHYCDNFASGRWQALSDFCERCGKKLPEYVYNQMLLYSLEGCGKR